MTPWKRLGIAMVAAVAMTQAPSACAGSHHVEDVASLIDKCTAEARAAHYVGGASAEEAVRVYDECIADGGVDAR